MCKRSAGELVADLLVFDGHVERFLDQFPRYRSWRVEKISRPPESRKICAARWRSVSGLSKT